MKDSQSVGGFFVVIFVSSFLLFFGAGSLILSFAPALAQLVSSNEISHLLPAANNRTEETPDPARLAVKKPYPALPTAAEVQPGNWILIPSIGVRVPLALSPSIKDPDIIKTLERGAALYPNGIAPGRLGNTFIAAHSTGNPWHGAYRFAFLKINQVVPGNEILLDYQGTRYTFRVVGSEIVKPAPDFRIVSDRPVPTVTLMACWPLWSTNNRMLVRGELTNITKLTATPS